MLYIAERHIRGVDMRIKEIIVNTLKKKHKEAEYLARNPFGALYILELNEGTFIFKSLSIIHYLEDRFPEKILLIKKLKEGTKTFELERITDVRAVNEMARYVHATKSPLGFT
jgi:glutathione S-transferase